LDAVSKQLDSAQTTFDNLKKVEANSAQMRALGVKYDAKAFEKQMDDLQSQLNNQVSSAVQDAINVLQSGGEKIDTMEELNQVK
jgi:hypothetical protein